MTVRDVLELTSSCTKWVKISDEYTGADIIAINPYVYDRMMVSDVILNQTIYCIAPADKDVLEIIVRWFKEEGVE